MSIRSTCLSFIAKLLLPVAMLSGFTAHGAERCDNGLCSASDSTSSYQEVRRESYRFSPGQIVVPAALIGVGVWGASGGWMHTVDKDLNKEFHFGGTGRVDDVLEFTPFAADILLGVAGVHTYYSIADRAISSVTSLIIAEATVQIMKHTVTVTRPDGSDSHSFPSGHSARAFAGAELTRIHYGNLWGLGAYGLAAATAVLRVGHQRHWLSDVMVGAGIGIISARVAMWLLPLEQRLMCRMFHRKEDSSALSQSAIIPYASPNGGGLTLVHTF